MSTITPTSWRVIQSATLAWLAASVSESISHHPFVQLEDVDDEDLMPKAPAGHQPDSASSADGITQTSSHKETTFGLVVPKHDSNDHKASYPSAERAGKGKAVNGGHEKALVPAFHMPTKVCTRPLNQYLVT